MKSIRSNINMDISRIIINMSPQLYDKLDVYKATDQLVIRSIQSAITYEINPNINQ